MKDKRYVVLTNDAHTWVVEKPGVHIAQNRPQAVKFMKECLGTSKSRLSIRVRDRVRLFLEDAPFREVIGNDFDSFFSVYDERGVTVAFIYEES